MAEVFSFSVKDPDIAEFLKKKRQGGLSNYVLDLVLQDMATNPETMRKKLISIDQQTDQLTIEKKSIEELLQKTYGTADTEQINQISSELEGKIIDEEKKYLANMETKFRSTKNNLDNPLNYANERLKSLNEKIPRIVTKEEYLLWIEGARIPK